jgi:hypothetical protein
MVRNSRQEIIWTTWASDTFKQRQMILSAQPSQESGEYGMLMGGIPRRKEGMTAC